MIPIQAVLVVGLLVIGRVYFTRIRSKLCDRSLVLAFVAASMFLVIRPDLTTALAHRLGVGRGTDLLFYFSLLGFSFVILLLFSSILELQEKVTGLTREIALISADRAGGFEARSKAKVG